MNRGAKVIRLAKRTGAWIGVLALGMSACGHAPTVVSDSIAPTVVFDPIALVESLTAEPAIVEPGHSVTLRWTSIQAASVRITRGTCPNRSLEHFALDVCTEEEVLATGLGANGTLTVQPTRSETYWCVPDESTIPVMNRFGKGVRVLIVQG
jgi:hypothetical protein